MYFLYTIKNSTAVRFLESTLFKNKSTQKGALIYICCTKRQEFDGLLPHEYKYLAGTPLTFLGRFCDKKAPVGVL